MKKIVMGFLAAVVLSASAMAADAVSRAEYGTLPDGRRVEAITLRGDAGVTAVVITYGATLQSLTMPDRHGKVADVALGPTSFEGYLKKPEYFGGTVGRFANRIARGAFTLDGKTYQTPRNNNGNALHGGERGFDKVPWDVVATGQGADASVTLRYVSPDGDQGYPGTLTATAIYSLKGRDLAIEYRATTDAPTVVNITNHAYWNLAGEGSTSAMGHVLSIPAAQYTPVDAGLIPTGEFRNVQGTPFDFRAPTAIGARVRDADAQIVLGRGYDHNFVIGKTVVATPRRVATVSEPVSGRGFELWSNQPGLQFYSGNFLDGTTVGKSGHLYRQGDAIALEPQLFPDTPNQPALGSARLAPGETYRNLIVYKFFVEGKKP
ncbi:MAG TPA: aldose epimerase family protein [Steroidobacteraceae bacterium]|nr:aldose epimerase family protein [Steroidobacteraceae bacterium]